MKKVILIDGNSLVFKAYYATAHTGDLLKAPNGKATNALRTTANMINKLIKEKKPDSLLVAFDAGKGTFRHNDLPSYKANRSKIPLELKEQFPIIKEYLDYLAIRHYELAQYEADDIIATIAKLAENQDMKVEIYSSDKDLLQLVSPQIDVCLTNKGVSNIDVVTVNNFFEKYSYLPNQVVDMKGLQGDSSDNLKGVPGVGPKTAIKLLDKYKTLENILDNIEDQKGQLKERLAEHKDQALLCKKIATLALDAPLEINLDDINFNQDNKDVDKLTNFLKFYGMNSLIKIHNLAKTGNIKIKHQIVNDIPNNFIAKKIALDIETDNENYNISKIIGLSISDGKNHYFIEGKNITMASKLKALLEDKCVIVVFDYQKVYNNLNRYGIDIKNVIFDIKTASYLIDSKITQDMFRVAQMQTGYWEILDDNEFYGKGAKWSIPAIHQVARHSVTKVKWIFDSHQVFNKKIEKENLESLYYKIELPSVFAIAQMEIKGILIDKKALEELEIKTKIKIDIIESEIYRISNKQFNISSTQQLGNVLFEDLGLIGTKTKTGQYSTTNQVLVNLINKHEIIPFIIQHRSYSKLLSTYILGFQNFICEKGRIHSNFLPTFTQTGRLSSRNPNLQNISIKSANQKEIRKSFIAPGGYTLASFDYSQIELRILAHLSNCTSLIEAYKNDIDIHTATASKVFNINLDHVSPEQRNKAKAVNFGIIYGISAFGLSKQLKTSVAYAKNIILNYKNAYWEIEDFRQKCIMDAKENGFVKTIFGRKRFIPELSSSSHIQREFGKRAATNAPIQGSSADIIKKAMVKINQELKENNIDASLVMQIHDELVYEIKNDHLTNAREIIIKNMKEAADLKVTLEVNSGSGISLADIK